MTTKIKLSRPITTPAGEVSVLELRELTGRDMVKVGKVPVIIKTTGVGDEATQSFEIDIKAAMKYAAELTAVDEVILGNLPARDFMAIAGAISLMFGDEKDGDLGNASA